jgi:hypothetical protein
MAKSKLKEHPFLPIFLEKDSDIEQFSRNGLEKVLPEKPKAEKSVPKDG